MKRTKKCVDLVELAWKETSKRHRSSPYSAPTSTSLPLQISFPPPWPEGASLLSSTSPLLTSPSASSKVDVLAALHAANEIDDQDDGELEDMRMSESTLLLSPSAKLQQDLWKDLDATSVHSDDTDGSFSTTTDHFHQTIHDDDNEHTFSFSSNHSKTVRAMDNITVHSLTRSLHGLSLIEVHSNKNCTESSSTSMIYQEGNTLVQDDKEYRRKVKKVRVPRNLPTTSMNTSAALISSHSINSTDLQ